MIRQTAATAAASRQAESEILRHNQNRNFTDPLEIEHCPPFNSPATGIWAIEKWPRGGDCKVHPNPRFSQFLDGCSVQSDLFLATSEQANWRLGAILFASRGSAFATVRKAPVEGADYEFAGLRTLPGGMARATPEDGPSTAQQLLARSLLDRVRREAALRPEMLGDLAPAPVGPLVTSYTAKERVRFTLVIPHTCIVAAQAELRSDDRSVEAAEWQDLPPDWRRIAPANRVVVAHLVWSTLSVSQRADAEAPVDEGVRQCSAWAALIGLPRVPLPWADREELERWRSAWPE